MGIRAAPKQTSVRGANSFSGFLLGPEARTFFLLVLVLAAGAIKDPRLLSAQNVTNILLWIPLLTVMAVGQMFVIVTRGIDVSVGATLGLTGMLVGMMFRAHPELNLALAIGLSLAIGSALGLPSCAGMPRRWPASTPPSRSSRIFLTR